MEYLSGSVEETQKIAQELAEDILKKQDRSIALVIALEGELGAGKTTFTQAFAEALGIPQTITSPTFVIMKSYLIPNHDENKHFKTLTHIDCYRLRGAEDILSLGFTDMLADPHQILLIEWPERIAEILPDRKITIHIDHISEHERKILVRA